MSIERPTRLPAPLPARLAVLENEAIYILCDGVASAERPVILFSGGKDSTVLAHLARKALFPARPPLPLLHIDSNWEFRDVVAFRGHFAASYGFDLVVFANEEGRAEALNPIDHAGVYTTMMRTEALKMALDHGRYDVIFGGARRDEEASRGKERIVSVRERDHVWDSRNQRPELWSLYNWRLAPGQTVRAFPLSNGTERDLWEYIAAEAIPLTPLYFAEEREVIEYKQTLIVLDDPARWGWPVTLTRRETVRFRTLGCSPVTGAIMSEATTPAEILAEVDTATTSERTGRVFDRGTPEAHKRDGYF
jgi:sulfate adenylyltransferase subunit 2